MHAWPCLITAGRENSRESRARKLRACTVKHNWCSMHRRHHPCWSVASPMAMAKRVAAPHSIPDKTTEVTCRAKQQGSPATMSGNSPRGEQPLDRFQVRALAHSHQLLHHLHKIERPHTRKQQQVVRIRGGHGRSTRHNPRTFTNSSKIPPVVQVELASSCVLPIVGI